MCTFRRGRSRPQHEQTTVASVRMMPDRLDQLLNGGQAGEPVRGEVDPAGEFAGAALAGEQIFAADADRGGPGKGRPCGFLGRAQQPEVDHSGRIAELSECLPHPHPGCFPIRTVADVEYFDLHEAIVRPCGANRMNAATDHTWPPASGCSTCPNRMALSSDSMSSRLPGSSNRRGSSPTD